MSSKLADKLPPQNIEAEKSLIGSLLLDKESINKVVDFLRPEDFYNRGHQLIFDGIIKLFEKREPIDLFPQHEPFAPSEEDTAYTATYLAYQAPEQHLKCSQNNSCVYIAGGGSNQDGCTSVGSSCNTGTAHHYTCNAGNVCESVVGTGTNTGGCDSSNIGDTCPDSVPAHYYTCSSGNVCQSRAGTGTNAGGCNSSNVGDTCPGGSVSHSECQNYACVSVSGPGVDSCSATADCLTPVTVNVSSSYSGVSSVKWNLSGCPPFGVNGNGTTADCDKEYTGSQTYGDLAGPGNFTFNATPIAGYHTVINGTQQDSATVPVPDQAGQNQTVNLDVAETWTPVTAVVNSDYSGISWSIIHCPPFEHNSDGVGGDCNTAYTGSKSLEGFHGPGSFTLKVNPVAGYTVRINGVDAATGTVDISDNPGITKYAVWNVELVKSCAVALTPSVTSAHPGDTVTVRWHRTEGDAYPKDWPCVSSFLTVP